MAQGKLYAQPVTYPTLSAVSGSKLKVTKTDRIEVTVEATQFLVLGTRAATTDPWKIQILERRHLDAPLRFKSADAVIDSDDLHWKAMGDLALKAHQRPSADRVFEYESGCITFGIADATKPEGYRLLTTAEAKQVLTCKVSQTGDVQIKFDPGTTGAVEFINDAGMDAIQKAMASVEADTTHTTYGVWSMYVVSDVSRNTSHGTVETDFKCDDIQGTEDITIGNYTGSAVHFQVETPAYTGVDAVLKVRRVSAGAAYSIPSITLDAMRRAQTNGAYSTVKVMIGSESDALTMTPLWDGVGRYGTTPSVIARLSIANPDAVFELSFDQANSIDVLATAAFAGVGGLVGVGVTTELQQLLANSPLSTIFSNAAAALGATTAAVISGYASALVAAYVNGWISNDQLFDLSYHANCLQSGVATLALAAGAGIAIGNIPSLLSYLGVNNATLSTAMAALGGAATSAGIALGMASIMSKVVRHVYWGE